MSSVDLDLREPCLISTECELEFDSSPARPRVAAYYRWKALFDRALAVLMLVPGLPLLGALILLVRVTSRGPAIFTQLRMGKNGRTFTMYKLRSMRQDAERGVGPVWSGEGDPRVTPIGRMLRKLHLDELPQLFNVLKGEMSLIGPRPERPEFVAVLAEQIPGYCDRLAVLPGVTGLAQINLPPDQTLDDVRRKLVLDREYIENAGLIFDLRMLVCTLLRLIGVPGVLATRITRLERTVSLPPEFTPVGSDDAEATPAGLAAILRAAAQQPAAANGRSSGTGHSSVNGNGKAHVDGPAYSSGNHLGPAGENGHARETASTDALHRTHPK